MRRELTQYQRVLLQILRQHSGGWVGARTLRTAMDQRGLGRDAGSFFVRVGRLLEAGLIDKQDEEVVVGDYTVRHVNLMITAKGEEALAEVMHDLEQELEAWKRSDRAPIVRVKLP